MRYKNTDAVPIKEEGATKMPNELKPCEKCGCLCRVQIVKTMANKYRLGCTIHNVWQESGYDSLDEAINAWNRRANDEQAD